MGADVEPAGIGRADRSQEDSHLWDVLVELVNDRDRVGAAKALGVNYRTLVSNVKEGQLPHKMRKAVQGFEAAEAEVEPAESPDLGESGRSDDQAEPVGQRMETLVGEVRHLGEIVEAQAGQLEELSRRLAGLEDVAGVRAEVGAGPAVIRPVESPRWAATEARQVCNRRLPDFMELKEAVQSGFENLTDFEGRATRSEFWWFWAAIAVPSIILSMVFASFIPFVGAFTGLAATVLTLSATVRRLHDSGRPGMWIVPFLVVTVLFTLIAFSALFSGAWVLALLASYVGALIQLIVGLVVLYFLVQPSDTGTNRYGPPPA